MSRPIKAKYLKPGMRLEVQGEHELAIETVLSVRKADETTRHPLTFNVARAIEVTWQDKSWSLLHPEEIVVPLCPQ